MRKCFVTCLCHYELTMSRLIIRNIHVPVKSLKVPWHMLNVKNRLRCLVTKSLCPPCQFFKTVVSLSIFGVHTHLIQPECDSDVLSKCYWFILVCDEMTLFGVPTFCVSGTNKTIL